MQPALETVCNSPHFSFLNSKNKNGGQGEEKKKKKRNKGKYRGII